MRLIAAAGMALATVVGMALAQCPGCPNATTCDTSKTASLKLASVNGDTFDLGQLKQPLVLLVAGTDSTSRTAAAAVQKSFAAAAEPAMFFAVINAGTKQAKTAAGDWKLGFTVLSDPDKKAMAWLETESVPLVAFLNRAGKVIKTETSVTEANVAEGVKALAQTEEKLIDPVCGMTVTKEGAAAKYDYKGKTYYFCSTACKENFARNPQRYRSQ